MFVSKHVGMGLVETTTPFVEMPRLAQVLSEGEGEKREMEVDFSFRHAYMPDERRTIEFIRSLSSLRKVVLRRDKGIWEAGYRGITSSCSIELIVDGK